MSEPIEAVLADQLRYYAARAGIYDTTYERTGNYDRGPEANEAWWSEIQVIADRLAQTEFGGHVLELGCGTGHWTEHLAHQAERVTAIDGADEMIAVAAANLAHLSNVDLRVQDVIDIRWSPADVYDGFAAFFFIEHVPDERLGHLLERVMRSLRPDALLFVAEGAPHPDQPVGVETRSLGDRSYRVVEHRRSATELSSVFARAGMTLEVDTVTERFSIARGRVD